MICRGGRFTVESASSKCRTGSASSVQSRAGAQIANPLCQCENQLDEIASLFTKPLTHTEGSPFREVIEIAKIRLA